MCILCIPLFVFLDKILYFYSDVRICIRNPYISHHHIWFSDTVGCLFHFIFFIGSYTFAVDKFYFYYKS